MARSAETLNLERISQEIDRHPTWCEWPPVAVAMNPFEIDRLGWDTIKGLPLQPEPNMGTGSFRIVCERPPSEAPGARARVGGTPDRELVEA